MNPTQIHGKIKLPISEAFLISIEQIRKRFTRSIIMIASIGLGIAFMTHINMTNVIVNAYMTEVGTTVEAYQFWLLIISAFVCCVGLINSTLIAVYERYTEIGTMKCLGALDLHILELFIIEAFLLGLFGGIFGFIIGIITATSSSILQLGFEVLLNFPIIDMLKYLGLTTILSIILSIGSTILPAFRAAKLNPVEALRYHV
jgi:ABC-type antimicrobial peptide transport system permease subunit